MASRKRKPANPKATAAEVYQLFRSLPLSQQFKIVDRCAGDPTNAIGIRLMTLWGETKRQHETRNKPKTARLQIIERLRAARYETHQIGKHPEFVAANKGRPLSGKKISRIINDAEKKGRTKTIPSQ